MRSFPRLNTNVCVWLALIVITLISWVIGENHFQNAQLNSLLILTIAFIKVYLVGMYFMELKHAPMPFKLFFNGWIILVGVGLALSYLIN